MIKFLRVIGILVSLLLMAGFGLCSAFGVAIGFDSGMDGRGRAMYLLLALAGLTIFALLGWGVWRLARPLMRPPSPPP